MEKKPSDTWELADQLEKIAKLLKKAPKFIFDELIEQKNQKLPEYKNLKNYIKMTLTNLKKECKNRRLKGYSKLSKEELIQLLQENDSGITTMEKINKAFLDK